MGGGRTAAAKRERSMMVGGKGKKGPPVGVVHGFEMLHFGPWKGDDK